MNVFIEPLPRDSFRVSAHFVVVASHGSTRYNIRIYPTSSEATLLYPAHLAACYSGNAVALNSVLLVSNPFRYTRYPDWGFRDLFKANTVTVPQPGHNRYLLNPFQLIIDESSNCSTLYKLGTDSGSKPEGGDHYTDSALGFGSDKRSLLDESVRYCFVTCPLAWSITRVWLREFIY
jgi:hypothetical protein